MTAYYSDTLVSIATTKMEISHMKEGDIAGLAAFQDPYCFHRNKEIERKELHPYGQQWQEH